MCVPGEIYFPVWGPITTTEARLMVTGHKRRDYDNTKCVLLRVFGCISFPVPCNPVAVCSSQQNVGFTPSPVSSCGRYEEQMFHFNTVTRVGRYAHTVRTEGIDFCYDCHAEVHILQRYLEKVCLLVLVLEFLAFCSCSCSSSSS